jgi:hypothetical protein
MQPHSVDALLANAYSCVASAKPGGQIMDRIRRLLQHACSLRATRAPRAAAMQACAFGTCRGHAQRKDSAPCQPQIIRSPDQCCNALTLPACALPGKHSRTAELGTERGKGGLAS